MNEVKTKQSIIISGAPGSGKSVYAEKLRQVALKEGTPVYTFSYDEITLRLYHEHLKTSVTDRAVKTQAEIYERAWNYTNELSGYLQYCAEYFDDLITIKEGLIIIDTAAGARRRTHWVNLLLHKKFTVTEVFIETPVELCIERQETRGDKKVSKSNVYHMHNTIEPFTASTKTTKTVIKGR